MYVIFLGPLALSGFAAVMFATGDFGILAKWSFVILTAVVATLQFVPAFQESVHFLIPLFMRLFVCGSWWFVSQWE